MLPPTMVLSPGVIKKTFTPGMVAWIKVLLTISIAPGPGLSTVLTGSGPAISPAGCYSPLLSQIVWCLGLACQAISDPCLRQRAAPVSPRSPVFLLACYCWLIADSRHGLLPTGLVKVQYSSNFTGSVLLPEITAPVVSSVV